MAPRFYRDPFVREAATTTIVATGEERFGGVSRTTETTVWNWVREITYSDGRTVIESTRSEPLPDVIHVPLGRSR